MLKRSLKEDSTFAPSLIFGLYYALEEKEMTGVKLYLSMVEKMSPPHPMLKSFRQILSLTDSARLAKNPIARAKYEFELAKTYAVMGLNDLGIEYALRVVALEERNVSALEVLASRRDGFQQCCCSDEQSRFAKTKNLDTQGNHL